MVRLGQEGFAWGWWELSKNTLKGAGTEKMGGDTKILKGGKVGQGVCALKRGGLEPLKNHGKGIYGFVLLQMFHA